MKEKKKRFSTIIFVVIFLIGLSLLLYPSIANYVNSLHSSRAIAAYQEEIAAIDPAEIERMWREAVEHNRQLWERGSHFSLSSEEKSRYEGLLNLTGDGVMGFIEIPSIGVSLPIYHGTEDVVLAIATGHLEWSSLPVGGENSHCVLSGHRGLPSAKLFTDLDQLVAGDIFMLSVLDEILTYEVDQILIVSPDDTAALQLEQGKDYCTLVTCTPYGINTHRLLVRGHRIENSADAAMINVMAEAIQVDEMIVAPILAVPLLIGILLFMYIRNKRKMPHISSLK